MNAQNKAFSSPLMSTGHLTERRATGGRTGRVRGPSYTVCVGLGSKVSPAMSLEAEQHINTFICPSVGEQKNSCATGLHLAPGKDGVVETVDTACGLFTSSVRKALRKEMAV